MALTVIDPTKDFTKMPNSEANSYVSLSDAQTYATDRGYSVTLTAGQLIRGADYVNSFGPRFSGEKVSPPSSTMQFPRTDAFLNDKYLDSNVIPELIKHAQIETALEIANNRDPQETTSTQVVKKEKVGDLEIEYDTQSGEEIPNYDYRRIDNLLAPILTDDLTRIYR